MPFTKEGMTPTIILNPHAIPKRRTIGHIIETTYAKSGAYHGVICDGTAFNEVTVADVCARLEETGYPGDCKEEMYCGFSGRKFEARINIGPVFYQRLKHLVSDKLHSRSKGPYQLWVRQPLEGRAKNGGHRVGDMEVWSFLSHGVAQTLKERFMECSDKAEFYVCNQCGMICIGNYQENHYHCTICDNTTNISKVEIPYATKLWLQIMVMMGVSPRMKLQNDDLSAGSPA
jgi:DNA-directed RNA polymerase beta subunit